MLYIGSTLVGNATHVVANVLTCNTLSPKRTCGCIIRIVGCVAVGLGQLHSGNLVAQGGDGGWQGKCPTAEQQKRW